MFTVFTPFQAKHHITVGAASPALFKIKKRLPFPIAAKQYHGFVCVSLNSVFSVSAEKSASSGAGFWDVSGVSDCAEGSSVEVSLSVGALLGVVGAFGAVGAVGSVDGSVDGSLDDPVDGPAVTLRSGVWVLLCCEPSAVTVITSPP